MVLHYLYCGGGGGYLIEVILVLEWNGIDRELLDYVDHKEERHLRFHLQEYVSPV